MYEPAAVETWLVGQCLGDPALGGAVGGRVIVGTAPQGLLPPYLRIQRLAALDEVCLPTQRQGVRLEYGLYGVVAGRAPAFATLDALCAALDARFSVFSDPTGAGGRPLYGERLAPEPLLQEWVGAQLYTQQGIRVVIWVEV